MAVQNVANNPIGSYPVKVTKEGAGAGIVNIQHVNVDNIAGISLPAYDYFSVAYPIATREVYTFKTGGSGGTTVATVTLNYTDATKAFLTDGAKT